MMVVSQSYILLLRQGKLHMVASLSVNDKPLWHGAIYQFPRCLRHLLWSDETSDGLTGDSLTVSTNYNLSHRHSNATGAIILIIRVQEGGVVFEGRLKHLPKRLSHLSDKAKAYLEIQGRKASA